VLCVFVCMCVRVRESMCVSGLPRPGTSAYDMCVCVCVRVRACMCVSGLPRPGTSAWDMCVCVCVRGGEGVGASMCL